MTTENNNPGGTTPNANPDPQTNPQPGTGTEKQQESGQSDELIEKPARPQPHEHTTPQASPGENMNTGKSTGQSFTKEGQENIQQRNSPAAE